MATFGFSRFIHILRQSLTDGAKRRCRPMRSADLEWLEERCVPAAIMVSADPGLFTTEAGGKAQFTVVLSDKPSKSVTIPIGSSDAKEGTASVKKLVFTARNWDQPQTVTVKGIDDKAIDGDKSYAIVFKPATGDKLYAKQKAADVHVVNKDDDTPAIEITVGPGLQTTEAGGIATFTVKLAAQPTADVVIPFHSSNAAEGTVIPSVKFTSKNWNKAQTVKITGVDDTAVDGDQAYQIIVDPAQSTDSHYAGLAASTLSVSVTNLDNDQTGGQPQSSNLDGSYTGQVTGTVKILGVPTSQTLPLAFTVKGDVFTVTDPGPFTGTITGTNGSFAPTSGLLEGATFTGGFTENPDGTVTFAGTWKISKLGVSGSGTLTATRPAPAA